MELVRIAETLVGVGDAAVPISQLGPESLAVLSTIEFNVRRARIGASRHTVRSVRSSTTAGRSTSTPSRLLARLQSLYERRPREIFMVFDGKIVSFLAFSARVMVELLGVRHRRSQ